jgi:2-polyprenyl-3-methyl-5-hydroxy-6-metoxy-1,4-benzoquinol methylase
MIQLENAVAKPVSLDRAVAEMLEVNASNDWFIGSYWPENKPRVLRMIRDVMSRFPPGARILDVGCGMGYISFLFARLGYRVMATDGWRLPERDELFGRHGIAFEYGNLNQLDPFADFPRDFDVVLMGEVIEHILNCPMDLIRSAGDAARSGALLVLTTPNPATLMNVWRLLRNKNSMWGTRDFATQPKMNGGAIIIEGDIHYREYTAQELREMTEGAGFRVLSSSYVSFGVSGAQPIWKRLVKQLTIFDNRLLAGGHYVLAEKV